MESDAIRSPATGTRQDRRRVTHGSNWSTEWDGFTVHPKVFHDAEDAVVVEGRYTGTYKPTGRDLDAQMTHVWRLRDGKVTSFQQYVDTAQMREVMGSS